MPDDPQTKPEEQAPAPAPEGEHAPEVVAEEVEDQTPPTSPVDDGLTALNKRMEKIEADLADHAGWRTSLVAEREAEKAEHRKTIEKAEEAKEKPDDKTKRKQEQKPRSRRLKFLRGTRTPRGK